MKKISRSLVLFFLSTTLLTSCNLPSAGQSTPNPNDVATRVAATLSVLHRSPSKVPQVPLGSPTAQPPAASAQPTRKPTAAATLAPTDTSKPTPGTPGTIEGGISGYPYGAVPKLTIVAFGQESPSHYSYFITAPGQTSFSMTSSYLIPGKYQVVAFDASGHAGGCTSIVTVHSDQTSTCDITDWSGSYPAKPAGVP